MARLTRREFLWSSVLGTVASVAGCSAAASAALRPIRADVEHKARKVVPPVEGMDWHGEWDELGAAAKREGALSLITVVGRGYRLAIESFEQAFPGVRVDHLAESSANVWLDQVRRGRRAGR
ncbi:MAG: hypothetical protein HY329_15695, partial [Chloroflexi bacterium]|nr:hypothetical protein [Chloroflexota bacterium]